MPGAILLKALLAFVTNGNQILKCFLAPQEVLSIGSYRANNNIQFLFKAHL